MGRAATGSVSERRLELAAQAQALRARGLIYREIGERLGVKTKYAVALVCDPDGSRARARKDSYRRPCPGWDGVPCGALMTGSNGRGVNAPELCIGCLHASQRAERRWTRDRIVEVFREFARETGRSPAVSDCWIGSGTPSQVERYSEARREERQALLPGYSIVRREFGCWGEALRAAGLEQRPGGGAGHRDYGVVEALIMGLPPEGQTAPEMQELLGVSKSCLYHALVELYRQGFLDRDGDGGRHDPFRYRLPS